MTNNYKNGFERIKVSDRLDEVVEKAVKSAIKGKKRNKIKSNLIKYSACAASIFIAFVISTNCIPVFAKYVENVPFLSTIAHAVQINYSKNLGNAINEGFSDDIHQSKMANDIKINITNVVSDNKNLYILYSLDGKKDKKGLQNILLNDLQITDSKGNVLINTNKGKDISQILTNRVIGKKGNFLIPMNSYGYFCVISSLGNNLESYSKQKETTGIIQLSADSEKNIPDKIKLTFLGFTEVYNTSYSKESYNNFVSKFKREPISLDVNCSFDININKKLSSIKPESYNDIKFTANNTDFKIKYLNIYPTYIEAKIQLGKNKVNNSQCIAVINKIGSDNSSLPYLIDEKGNKYMPHMSHAFVDSDNCQTITFESSYFNGSKELYLIINQLSYANHILNITPVKVKIK
ncbi:DUF4179 domain-containing protein [Clostridium autoethanogenum]|uniref:DUF4179 domain-containing protein n=1 Tax=Clostridium autoethanogenum TaxID=84023 RepID=A0A3M0SQ55_9CLOT|nr:DUF4179 domain-containing protein [Clostridium autoethanogenum]RMD00172.1 DUF4179 domain-containing protein [Clostridium autoethanogenum]